MKKALAAAVLTTMIASLAVPAFADEAAEKTTITFWHYMSEDTEGQFVNEIDEAF